MSPAARPIAPADRRFLTGLIGAPIAHSASPAMHERAAEALGAHCHYQLIEVAGASREELKLLLDGMRRLGFAGVNVTFPYKEAVVSLLDELSSGARAIGAVNTVVVQDGRLIGHNTDTTGFARAITELVRDPVQSRVAVIGAGGVGKAIGFALAETGVSEIRVFDTDAAKAAQLVGQIANRGSVRVAGSVEEAMRGVTGVVNGSPVGMLPNRGTPVPDSLLHKDMWVADAVYTPLWTPLLNAAKAKGAEVMTGRELAIYQAADAFELFTGLKPSAVEMGNAFDAVMAKRYAKVNAA
ncbi:shikimate dehydrogenase [Bradyrhizobium sp. CCBAU 051011]|uniref:shikimate dehydrogenase n=1 Tax=Bradyrhizobium sp. CCBAU 051011 TaxID=858422 RepID=UPI0013742222|nr:shikimate dehydrogenase [Bradyrhizobium sp. CCBAU 051011]QHO73322.1 shikimate dehydrogenase [Bradyrhizobium sp. CCBAU 051011]